MDGQGWMGGARGGRAGGGAKTAVSATTSAARTTAAGSVPSGVGRWATSRADESGRTARSVRCGTCRPSTSTRDEDEDCGRRARRER